MVDLEKEKLRMPDLLEIMEILRGENGCPWDRAQTHASLRRDFLEETYEAVEAIDRGDDALLREELGDVLLQVVFHASIAAGQGAFDMDDVIDGLCRKLVFRHPHVFGQARADTPEQVLDAWDTLKRAEKRQQTHTQVIEQVAKSLPALMYAEKIQSKAKKAGFDWPDVGGALGKVDEELGELRQAVAEGGDTADELGDLLFSVVNVARFLKADPEQALLGACAKFVRRFSSVEAMAGRPLESMSLAELDRLWDIAKNQQAD